MKDNFNIFQTKAFEVKLATNQAAKISKDLSSGMIKIGKKNDYPSYLIFLYNNHPEHGGIVRGKSRYLSGLGTKPLSGNEQANIWLKRANPKESWEEVRVKCEKDKVIFGGYYIKIHTNALGVPVWHEHISWAKVRKTDKGNYVICEDYKKYDTSKKVFLPKFQEGLVGTSVYEWKSYTPTENDLEATYPQTEYTSGILDIDTDIRVGTFFNSIVKNNFSAGTIITVFNGETDAKKKQEIVSRIKGEYEGEDEAGKTTVVFVGKDGKPTEVTRLNANDLDKQYKEVNLRNMQKIVAAHNIPAELFKIKLDNKALLSRTEIVQLHELFINEYAKPEQAHFNDTLSYFYKLETSQVEKFEVEQIKLVGQELPLDNANVVNALNAKDPNIVLNYLIDKYSIDVPKVEVANPLTTPTNVEANDHLKNLTGKQFQNLNRIVTKYNKGIITKDAALMMLKSAFNLTDEQALVFLDTAKEESESAELEVKQSIDKEHLFFQILAKYSHPINDDDEIICEYEVNPKATKLASVNEVPSDKVLNSILEQLKGNPFATIDDIAKQLELEVGVVDAAINKWLIPKGIISKNDGELGFTPTEKGYNTDTGTTLEFYTEYTYELRPDAPTTRKDGTPIESRDFCSKLLKLYGNKKNAVSYEFIEGLDDNEFGDNVWDFKGGFYTNGNTGQTTPWCRHFWKATVKARKKQK